MSENFHFETQYSNHQILNWLKNDMYLSNIKEDLWRIFFSNGNKLKDLND
jgi:hypothetical protein